MGHHTNSNNYQHPDGTNLLCTCDNCPPGRRQKFGAIVPGHGVTVVDKRHGTYHAAVLDVREVLVRLAGTVDGSAIQTFVARALG